MQAAHRYENHFGTGAGVVYGDNTVCQVHAERMALLLALLHLAMKKQTVPASSSLALLIHLSLPDPFMKLSTGEGVVKLSWCHPLLPREDLPLIFCLRASERRTRGGRPGHGEIVCEDHPRSPAPVKW